MKKTVVYYTRPCYLDAALEYINITKQNYNLHVVIQISNNELTSNIIDIKDNIKSYPPVVSYEVVKERWKLSFLDSYFDGCKSINFLIFNGKMANDIKTSRSFVNLLETLKPNYIHFDDFTGKQVLIVPFLLKNRSKLVLNVHDPKPHSGEFQISRFLVQNVLYGLARKKVVFSKYSKQVLLSQLKGSEEVHVLRLLPYSVFESFYHEVKKETPSFISFVGRLSPYKGIDIFINAIEDVIKDYPSQKFLIAGKALFGYKLDNEKIKKIENNLVIYEKHLTNEEMASYIINSKVIVCPYLDATQSGVIMAAFSLGRPVIVTNVGGLPEYISNENMGYVTEETNSESLAKCIKLFLLHEGRNKNENLISKQFKSDSIDNLKKMEKIYI